MITEESFVIASRIASLACLAIGAIYMWRREPELGLVLGIVGAVGTGSWAFQWLVS